MIGKFYYIHKLTLKTHTLERFITFYTLKYCFKDITIDL